MVALATDTGGGEGICFHRARSSIHFHSPVSGLCHLSSSTSKCTLQGSWSHFPILPGSSSLISIALKVKLCPQPLVGSSLQRLLGYFHFLFLFGFSILKIMLWTFSSSKVYIWKWILTRKAYCFSTSLTFILILHYGGSFSYIFLFVNQLLKG